MLRTTRGVYQHLAATARPGSTWALADEEGRMRIVEALLADEEDRLAFERQLEAQMQGGEDLEYLERG